MSSLYLPHETFIDLVNDQSLSSFHFFIFNSLGNITFFATFVKSVPFNIDLLANF